MKAITAAPELSVIPYARTAETFLLALWIGMTTGFAFVFAPAAFRLVTDLRVFAALTGGVIEILTRFGFVATGIAFATECLGPRSRAGLARLGCLLGAFVLLLVAHGAVIPRMAEVMARMHGDIAAYAPTSPERLAYREAHALSSRVYGGALLLGCAAFFLGLARGGFARPAAHPREG